MNALRTVGSGIAAVLGSGVAIASIALWFGGVSFRKDCLTERGTVESSWSFPIYAILPYVFRPSEDGCSVHSGTRVALDAVGLFPFSDDRASVVADATADVDDVQRYYVRLNEAVSRYGDRNEKLARPDDAQASIDEMQSDLGGLEPPPAFEEAHGLFEGVLAKAEGLLDEYARLDEMDASERVQFESDVQDVTKEVAEAISEIERVYAVETGQ